MAANGESEKDSRLTNSPGRTRKLVTGVEADDWDEDAALSAPQTGAGFETPSQGTPGHSPPLRPQCAPGAYGQPTSMVSPGAGDGLSLTCVDQWEWKTDAPEFVPSFGANHMGMMADIAAYPEPPSIKDHIGTNDGHTGNPAITNIRAQYEMQLQRKFDEVWNMKERIRQLENETSLAQESYDSERRRLLSNVKRHRDVLELYCIPLEEADAVNPIAAGQDEPGWQYDLSAGWAANDMGRGAGSARNGAGGRAWAGGDDASGATWTAGGFGDSSGMYSGYGTGAGDDDANADGDLDSKMRQLGGLISAGRASGGGRLR